MPEIIAISTVKNEDIYVKHAVNAVLDFADRVIVVDNGSTDGTLDILRSFGDAIELEHEHDLTAVHGRFIEPHAGRDLWMFGFDGDEIYDKERLTAMRERVLFGEFNNYWQVRGRFVHVTEIVGTTALGYARGYHAPPARNSTKLFNFKILESWKACGTRSWWQPKTKRFKPGYKNNEHQIFPELSWDECPLRCIHMRHLQRSTQEPEETRGCRLGMEDNLGGGSRKDRGGQDDKSYRLSYRQGELGIIDLEPFFK